MWETMHPVLAWISESCKKLQNRKSIIRNMAPRKCDNGTIEWHNGALEMIADSSVGMKPGIKESDSSKLPLLMS
jgi:hypothetical protein